MFHLIHPAGRESDCEEKREPEARTPFFSPGFSFAEEKTERVFQIITPVTLPYGARGQAREDPSQTPDPVC